MTEDKIKIYYPNEIEDTPIEPMVAETGSTDSTTDESGVLSPDTITDEKVPNYILASDLINASLDTQKRKILSTYGFSESGAIQIGKYVAAVSGQINISPDGIVGINKSNVTTFAIDGTTGDATFLGTVAAGSIIAASITVDGSSTFGAGYDPTTKVDEIGGSYVSTATAAAAKVKIFPDANTGIIAYTSDGTTVVFKVEVGGTNVGDVTIGNYAGGVGMLWDQSAGALYVKGDISASTGDISGNRISGGTIDGVNLKIGSGDAVFKADSNGIYLGDATYADAPFRVNMDGDVVAKSIVLWGTIATDSGAYLRTSSGNDRIEFTNSDKVSFYKGGTLRGSLTGASATRATGIIADSDICIANGKSFMMKSSGGGATEYSGIGLATNAFWLTLGTDNTFYIKNNAQDENYFTVSSSKTFSEHDLWVNANIKYGDGSNRIDGELDFQHQLNFNRHDYLTAIIDENFWTDGNLMAGGSKPFIIPHPDGSDRLLRYTAQESPDVSLRFRGIGEIVDGTCNIEIPEHFVLVTEPNGLVTVNLTPMHFNQNLYVSKIHKNDEVLIAGEDGKFMFEIVAIRKGYLDYEVEISATSKNIKDVELFTKLKKVDKGKK